MKAKTLCCLVPGLLASGGAWADDVTVGMKNSLFSPPTVTVRAGDRVVWVNDDEDGKHQVYFNDASYGNSGNLKPGAKFSVVFDKPGEIDYYCRTHKDYGMVGKIVVTAPPK